MSILRSLARLYELLPRSGRRTAWVLLLLALLNGLAEVVGIASLLPLMGLVARPELLQTNPWMAWAYHALAFSSPRAFLLALAGAFMSLFMLTYAVNSLTYWYTCRFSYDLSHQISTRLLRQYLYRPYTWFLVHNTTDLTKDVLGEVEQLVDNLILRLAGLVTKVALSSAICIWLCWLNPAAAATSGLGLVLLYRLIYRFFKARLRTIGEERIAINRLRYKLVSEALAALKEARSFARRDEFSGRFEGVSRRYNDIFVRQRLIGELPRQLTEVLAIGAIVGVLMYLIFVQQESQAIPLITVYILATWRLVPALQDAYHNAATAHFYAPLLERLQEELGQSLEPQREMGPPLRLERGLRLQEITFAYPQSEGNTLRGVSMELARGTSVALVGTTGAGKTTMADVAAGLLAPGSGTVWVDDLALEESNRMAWLGNVGYVPQDIYLTDDTVRRNIALGLPDEEIDEAALLTAARSARIHDFVLSLEHGYDTLLGERGVNLSGGQRQRLGIARALYPDPELLILDEATSSLDAPTEQAVMDAIGALQGRKTLLVIAHRISTVQACNNIYLLEHGQVVASGTFPELLEKSPQFRALARPGLSDAPKKLVQEHDCERHSRDDGEVDHDLLAQPQQS